MARTVYSLHYNSGNWRVIALMAILPVVQFLFSSQQKACAQANQAGERAGRLETTSFVVMGEGLAAGMANFGLNRVGQSKSFPAQMAAQMKTPFPQPLFQEPGLGDVVGYPGQEVKLHTYPTGAVRVMSQPDPGKPAAPPMFVQNLSIPGLTLAESISLRPVAPVSQRSMKQTVVNLILGFPQLLVDNAPLWSQLEYAKAMKPTLALVELGFYEAIDAAVAGDSRRMPEPAAFGKTYAEVLAGLRSTQAQVIATTIPNPIDTAYFSSPDVAATIVLTTPTVLTGAYHLTSKDYITRNGLLAISNQFSNRAVGNLPPGSTLSGAAAEAITTRIKALNAQIAIAAKANGALVYDMNAFFHKIKASGIAAGSKTLSADYLGGFYTLDAVYPGPTGHSLIANDILSFLNTAYHASIPLVDVSAVAAGDPIIMYQKPKGEPYTASSLGLRIP